MSRAFRIILRRAVAPKFCEISCANYICGESTVSGRFSSTKGVLSFFLWKKKTFFPFENDLIEKGLPSFMYIKMEGEKPKEGMKNE